MTPKAWHEAAARALEREQHRRPIPCDECDSGDTPVDGFHLVYTDEYDVLGTWKVPCPRHP